MATKSIGLLAALAPAMAIRQLMSDVRPDEEAALRALVQPVEGCVPQRQLGKPTVSCRPRERGLGLGGRAARCTHGPPQAIP